MKNTEIQAVCRAITLLSVLINEPQECVSVPWQSPVRRFVEAYLVADPNADLTSAEAWKFFQEIVQAGELMPMRRSVFLRQLPNVMAATHHTHKSHHVERMDHRVRGFRGVGIRMDAGLPPTEAESEIE